MMRYPLDELLDKKSIVQLKIERIGGNEKKRLEGEFKDYTSAIEEYISLNVCTKKQIEKWYTRLYEANKVTWDLESRIRSGQIGEMSLEEVGRTAIKIRESNGNRVRIKGEIVEKTGVGYKDIKINHASQENYNSNP